MAGRTRGSYASDDTWGPGVKVHTRGRCYHCAHVKQCCGDGDEEDGGGDEFLKKGNDSTGLIKIKEPLNPLLNYFEVLILDKGRDSAVGIGAGEMRYPAGRMPGWSRRSCGYHADNGKLYQERGTGEPFGPTCTAGDRMGCGVAFGEPEGGGGEGSVRVFFTKNGRSVGDRIVRMRKPDYGLYPLIGMHSNGERVKYLGHWRRDPDADCPSMEEDSSSACSPSSDTWLRCNAVQFLGDGLTLEYAGNSPRAQDVAIAQCCRPLDPTNHYFEMELLSLGADGALALGLAQGCYPLHRHPGWESGSVGYHADDGKIFHGCGQGDPFGPTCTEGDVMGCGIRFPSSDDNSNEDNDADMEEGVEGGEGGEGGGDSDSSISYSPEEGDDFDDNNGMGLEDLIPYDSDEDEDDFHAIFARERRRAFGRFGRGGLFGGGGGFGRRRMWEGGGGGGGKREGERGEGGGGGKKCRVYFTKNGEEIGEVECSVPRGGFYPVVAMLSRGEKLRVNFNPITG